MKKFLILIAICFTQNTHCQNYPIKGDADMPINEESNRNHPQKSVPNDDFNIYNADYIDLKPQFPGGAEALEKFIKNNYKNPKDEIRGKVYINFVIEKDGALSDIKIIRDIGYETGAEAVKVMKKSPKWIPGKLKNKFIRTSYILPISVNIIK